MPKIVLVAPEIPFNTGAIGRTCVALDIELILIKPYGFSLDEKSVARAGTRYWPHVQLSEYDSWDHFIANEKPAHDELFCLKRMVKQVFTRQIIPKMRIWYLVVNLRAYLLTYAAL